MRVMGIDPGSISGAWSLIDTDACTAHVGDLPVVEKQVAPSALYQLIKNYRPDVVCVELVGAMPGGQGVASTFNFGKAAGIIEGVIAAAGIPMHRTRPAQWKKHFTLDRDKEKSRALAMRLYPLVVGLERKKDSGRGEALLLARYYIDVTTR